MELPVRLSTVENRYVGMRMQDSWKLHFREQNIDNK